MVDACNMAIYFLVEVFKAIPDSPMMFLFGLAIVVTIYNMILIK
jgi:hypothetical protein